MSQYLSSITLNHGIVTGGHFAIIASNDNSLTITFDGEGNSSFQINTAHANTWTALQKFGAHLISSPWGVGTTTCEIFGAGAGNPSATGDFNTGFGQVAMSSMTTGFDNAGFGAQAMRNETTGVRNTCVGSRAMANANGGTDNTSVGYLSLVSITGSNNCAFGSQCMSSATAVSFTNAFGFGALSNITTGLECNAFGKSALGAVTTGSFNVGFGSSAGVSVTTASNCTFIGRLAGEQTNGDHNTGIGDQGLRYITSGVNNIGIGGVIDVVGTTTTGSYNCFLGYRTDGSAAGTSYGVALGYQAICASNECAFGPNINVQTGQVLSSTSTIRPRADFTDSNVDNTDATRKYRRVANVWDTAQREAWRIEASGTAAKIGFLGASAAVQQSGDPGAALVTFGLMSSANASRIQLTADRTYYVRTDGNDSNTGLVDSAGGAFLTIQKGIDTASNLDNGGHNITIQVDDGTYTGAVILKAYVGSGTMTLQGNTTTPSNCVISTTSANCITVSGVVAPWTVTGFRLKTTTSGDCINASKLSVVNVGKMDFNTCVGSHMLAVNNSIITHTANYSITGNAAQHWDTQGGSSITAGSITITLTGTPAFSTFAVATLQSLLRVDSNTFSGSATGTRYFADLLSAIYTASAGATYLPGNVGGSVTNGAVYE